MTSPHPAPPPDRPLVAVVSLGGTITMTPTTAGGTVTPTLRAEDLVAAVPELLEVAEVVATTVVTLPGASLLPGHLLAVLERGRAEVDAGAAGVVVVQGTDTIEESAYLLDLWWDRASPLVVTGAMRAAGTPGSDGPANLLAAVRTAAAPGAGRRGVLVVLDDTVHEAGRVAKAASTATSAFVSPSFGPAGRVHEGTVVFAAPPPPRAPALPLPGRDPAPVVRVLTTWLGDDGEMLDEAVASGCAGVVLAAFGVGHVPARVAERVGVAAQRLPVVLATRTGSGSTARSVYGFPGSESDLIARGAVPAGWLGPLKARTLLWALLAADCTAAEVRGHFADRGEPQLEVAGVRRGAE